MHPWRRLIPLLMVLPLVLGPTAGHAADSAKKKGGGLSYIQFPTLTATIFHGDGSRGVLTIESGVDVSDAGLRARAQASQPRLSAAYLMVLQAYASGLAPTAPPDADYIARTLQRETDRVLGRPGARLLLGSIMID
jgi:hypothetical protein